MIEWLRKLLVPKPSPNPNPEPNRNTNPNPVPNPTQVSVWLRKLLGWQERDTTLILTDANTKDLEQLASKADGTGPFGRTKRLAPVIFKTLPFAPDAVDEGFVLLKSRRVVGKVVFDMSRSS